MNRVLRYILFFYAPFAIAQGAFYNSGTMTIHEDAQTGFYGDLINEGDLKINDNTLLGFYGFEGQFYESNAFLSAFDIEFGSVFGDVILLNRLEVRNNANFISSQVVTPLNASEELVLNFDTTAFYSGENDETHVVGFAGMNNQTQFIFPIGDLFQLRPLALTTSDAAIIASSAYIRENPSAPSTYSQNFDIDSRARDIGGVSANEFWVLRSESESQVTLTWNAQSNLSAIADDVGQIILVGWNIAANQWVTLSEPTGSGTLQEGIITSSSFIPSRYGAITFGITPLPTDTFAVNNPSLGNYFVSPNGDGINDFLVFDELEGTGDNVVFIYNRFGQKVFEIANYTNQFNGVSNTNNVILQREIGLPEGMYYYMIDLLDVDLQYQGFFFLDR